MSLGLAERAMRATFSFTYAMLLTTGTVTFIEALRTDSPAVRHVMNIETCVSVVAAFFYNELAKRSGAAAGAATEADYAAFTSIRYTDWCVTTPLMLLGLCIVLSHHDARRRRVTLLFYGAVLAANYAMLGAGVLGESGALSKPAASAAGFAAYAGLFALVYFHLVCGSGSRTNTVLFGLFSGLWALYGVVYNLADPALRNAAYNVLDLLAKCVMGLVLWAYFTRIVVL